MSSPSWNLDQVTQNLRAARTEWRGRHPKVDIAAHRLPSVLAIEHVVERLVAALYPQRLGTFASQGPEEDVYVAGELRDGLSTLLHQLNFEPALSAARAGARPSLDTTTIIREFAQSLSAIRRLADADIEAAQTIATAGGIDELLLCASAPLATLRYRLAHQLYILGAPLIAQIMSRAAYALTGVYIHPSAEIGPHFCIEHGSGTRSVRIAGSAPTSVCTRALPSAVHTRSISQTAGARPRRSVQFSEPMSRSMRAQASPPA